MNRRIFSTHGIAALASATLAQHAPAQHQPTEADADRSMEDAMRGPRQQIAMLVYPQFTALDLISPHTFLAALMNCDVHLVWKDKNPVPLDRGGSAILPTKTLEE